MPQTGATKNCHAKWLESLHKREIPRTGAVQDALSSVRRHIGRPGAQVMPHSNTAFTIDAGSWHHATRRAEPLWRSWCKSPIWKSIRRHRLAEEPRCRQCAIEGRTVAASHVDHITPHLGQWLLFFKYENTQSLCAHHHNMHKQQERRGNTTHPPAERLDGAWPRV
jgi:5-methylcytosine-specific restriction protein A